MDSQKTFVQKYLVLPKLCFFLLYMAIYSYSGLGPAYFKENWGFNNSDVGYLMALQGVNFVGAIFWTSMADKTGKHKHLLVTGTMLWAFFVTANAIPRMIGYKFSSTLISIFFTSVFMIISNFCQASMFPLLDSAMISMLSQDPSFTKDQFGLQRLFGSPGHFLAAIIQGTTDYLPRPQNVWLYQAIIVFWSLAFSGMVMLALPNHTKQIPKSFTHHGHKDQGKPNHLSQATALPLAPSPIVPAAPDVDVEPTKKNEASPVVQLLTNPGFLFFLLFVISAGFLANSLTIYQSIMVSEFYAKHGKKKEEKSLLMTATTKLPSTISEITIFFFSRSLMRTFGVYWLLLASQFFGILRMMAYVYMPSDAPKWFPHAIEVLKGLNSGLIVSAAVRIASDIAPAGCSNSAQGLFSGVYKGLSVSFTGFVGGLMLQYLVGQDIQKLFFWVAMFAIFTTVCFFFKFLLVDKTIGFSCGGGAKQAPAMAHDTASTSSFGSTASTTDVQSTAPMMKVGGDKKLAV